MLNIFNTNKPFILFLMPILALAVWFPGLTEIRNGAVSGGLPFFSGVHEFLSNRYVRMVTVFAVILASGLLLNYIIVKHDLLVKNTNLPATVYVVLFAMVSITISMNPVIFANLFLILALDRTLTLYNQQKVYEQCFQAGILISIATHFYMPACLFIILFMSGLLIIRTFEWRDLVITIFGFITPFLYSWTYYFWFDRLKEYNSAFLDISGYFNNSRFTVDMTYEKVIYACMVIFGMWKLLGRMSRETVRTRNLLSLMLIYFGISLLTLLLNKAQWIDLYLLSIVPLTLMLSILFQSLKKTWVAETAFGLFLAVMIVLVAFKSL